MERENRSTKLPIGSTLPSFSLLNVNNDKVDAGYFSGAKAALVAFTCNHCPYVKGSEEMLIEIVRKYQSEGLKAVTINSNDAEQYPEDSFENMQRKAKEMNLPYPYLYDQSQEVAKLFDAECTPEFFLFDSAQKLVYHGTINDSPRDPLKVTKNYLRAAVEQVLAGQKPDPAFVNPLGCSIKWRR